ncbi:unnamed protein product [Ambrosiozyma monospora]|uniref:Unnamed protein product n=1 Tax=Ambrosiozyma monospora TaxID=43982 RepID=A0ACB5T3B3_AMBMO|nr:unnamed protein product [Ambrosiozyma monospora]
MNGKLYRQEQANSMNFETDDSVLIQFIAQFPLDIISLIFKYVIEINNQSSSDVVDLMLMPHHEVLDFSITQYISEATIPYIPLPQCRVKKNIFDQYLNGSFIKLLSSRGIQFKEIRIRATRMVIMFGDEYMYNKRILIDFPDCFQSF